MSSKQRPSSSIDVDGAKVSYFNAGVILTSLKREFPDLFQQFTTSLNQMAMLDDEESRQEIIGIMQKSLRDTFKSAKDASRVTANTKILPPSPPPFVRAQAKSSWKCNTCTFENDGGLSECTVCGEKNTIPTLPPPVESVASNIWKCKKCTFENSASNTTCEICSESRDGIQPSPVLGGSVRTTKAAVEVSAPEVGPNQWACSKCSFINISDHTVCQICCEAVSPRGDKWACSGCTSINDESNKSCCTCGFLRKGPRKINYSAKDKTCCVSGYCIDETIYSWYSMGEMQDTSVQCNHEMCDLCLRGHIESKINSRDFAGGRISCPMPSCKTEISQAIIREVAGRGLFEIYEDSLSEAYKNQSFIHCPSEHCNFCFDWDATQVGTAFDCPECKQSYCLRCQIDSKSSNAAGAEDSSKKLKYSRGHAPYSCSQERDRLEKDKEAKRKYEEWKQLNANADIKFREMMASNKFKMCPACNCPIERNEGCDHMTCKNCKANFCYVCGKYDQASPTKRGDCGSSCPNKKR